jgi:hypothetical protein
MSRLLAIFVGATVAAAQPPPATDPSARPVIPTPAGPVIPALPAPAIHPGMPLFDRSGVQIGEVQAAADTPRGLEVVVKVDGKLLGAPLSTLRVEGDHVVSSQTKEQLLVSTGAAH